MTKFLARITNTPPVLVFLIVVGGLFMVEYVAFAISRFFQPDVYPPTTRVYMAVTMVCGLAILLGYPIFVATELRGTFGNNSAVNGKKFFSVLIFTLSCYIILFVAGHQSMSGNPYAEIVVSFATVPALVGIFYIYWVAARALVYIEESPPVSFYRVARTFVMFVVLPVGVLFLHRRLQKLVRQRELQGT